MKDGDELLKKHHNAKNCIKLYDDVFTYTSQFINTYTGRQFIYSFFYSSVINILENHHFFENYIPN